MPSKTRFIPKSIAGDVLIGSYESYNGTNNKQNKPIKLEPPKPVGPHTLKLNEKKVIAITPQGLVFEKAENLNDHVKIKEIPAFGHIVSEIEPDIANNDLLKSVPWTNYILTKVDSMMTTDEQCSEEDPLPEIDAILNSAEILLDSLTESSKDSKIKDLKLSRFANDLNKISEELTRAAKKIGKRIAVYDDLDDLTIDRLNDFNRLFERGFNLNAKFLELKLDNPAYKNALLVLSMLQDNLAKVFEAYLDQGHLLPFVYILFNNLLPFVMQNTIQGVQAASYQNEEGPTEAGYGLTIPIIYFLFHTIIISGCRDAYNYRNSKDDDIFNFKELNIKDISASSKKDTAKNVFKAMNSLRAGKDFDDNLKNNISVIESSELSISKLLTLNNKLLAAENKLKDSSLKTFFSAFKDILDTDDNNGKNDPPKVLPYRPLGKEILTGDTSINKLLKKPSLDRNGKILRDPMTRAIIYEQNFAHDEFNTNNLFLHKDLTYDNIVKMLTEVTNAIKTLENTGISTEMMIEQEEIEKDILGISIQRKVAPRTRTSQLKAKYSDYSDSEKIKYFTALSKNIKNGRISPVGLHPETTHFLTQYVKTYKTFPQGIVDTHLYNLKIINKRELTTALKNEI